MLTALKTAAYSYLDGLITSKEFLALVVEHTGNQWQKTPDTADNDEQIETNSLAKLLAEL